MSDSPANQRWRQSIFLSVGINCLMVLTGTVASIVKPLRWLSWVSRVIATPPGWILRFLIRPSTHSVASYAIAAFAGILGSLVFYTLIAWGALWLAERLRGAPPSGPS